MENIGVDIGLIAAYVLTAIATIGFFGSELLYIVRNISDAKNTLIGIGALLAVVIVGYLIGSGVTPDQATIDAAGIEVTSSTMAKVNGGLITSYILMAIAALAMVADMVMGIIKK